MLICPICALPLKAEEKRAFCEKGHSFDRAKEGYFNLLLSSSAKGHGDDRAMLTSRRAFLEKGYYAHLLSSLLEVCLRYFPERGILVDAGCGEGYYTSAIRDRLVSEGKGVSLFAFDIAKEAARLVSKKLGKEGTVFVGSSYRMPLADASADMILSLFSPFSEEEFLRVLKPGGTLVRAVPMPEHLFSLKKAVYETPKKNEGMAEIGREWCMVSENRVKKEIVLTCNEDIRALFGMTPYAHKTSREDMAKLEELEGLTVETDFGVLVYRKKPFIP